MEEFPESRVRLYVVRLSQDDPRKCTSAKLVRFKLARPVKASHIPRRSILLDPYVKMVLSTDDKSRMELGGLTAIDCSWKRIQSSFSRGMKGYRRRLPLLLAANPINYGKIGKLSSLEALAAALYITSHVGQAERLLSLFKWGETFLTLNHEPLDRYKACKDVSDLERAEKEFFNLNAVNSR